MLKRILGAAVCGMLGSGTGYACATVSFSPTSVSISENEWSPFPSGNTAAANFTVTVTPGQVQQGQHTTSVRLIFIDPQTGSPVRLGSGGPDYAVLGQGKTVSYASGTSLAATPTISSVDFQWFGTGSNRDASAKQSTLSLSVPPNNAAYELVGGTTYGDNLSWSLTCYNNTDYTGSSATVGGTIPAGLTVGRRLEIITASPQTLDFGKFTTLTQQLMINLRSTSAMTVGVSTQNGGKLVRKGAASSAPAGESIPYAMTFNGSTIAPGLVAANLARAGVSGVQWPFVMTLAGLPVGKRAGDYEDTITLTLAPAS